MKLQLSIDMGNDAMQDGTDLATALRREAARLEDGFSSGYITDANGNQVGHWEITGYAEREAAIQAERDRLMPQACGHCGAEVDEDGGKPDHFDWCPEYDTSTLAKEDARNAWQLGEPE